MWLFPFASLVWSRTERELTQPHTSRNPIPPAPFARIRQPWLTHRVSRTAHLYPRGASFAGRSVHIEKRAVSRRVAHCPRCCSFSFSESSCGPPCRYSPRRIDCPWLAATQSVRRCVAPCTLAAADRHSGLVAVFPIERGRFTLLRAFRIVRSDLLFVCARVRPADSEGRLGQGACAAGGGFPPGLKVRCACVPTPPGREWARI